MRIDSQHHPFLCVSLAQSNLLDLPFEKEMALLDYLFHRLEEVCYEFVKRSRPGDFKLMCLESHDEIDLVGLGTILFPHRLPMAG